MTSIASKAILLKIIKILGLPNIVKSDLVVHAYAVSTRVIPKVRKADANTISTPFSKLT
jgi:hypothetical protein